MNFKLFLFRRLGSEGSMVFARLYGPVGYCNIFKCRVGSKIFTTERSDKKISVFLPIENPYGPMSYTEVVKLNVSNAVQANLVQALEVYEDVLKANDIYNVSYDGYPVIRANILYSPEANFNTSFVNKEVKIRNIHKNYFWQNIPVPYGDNMNNKYDALMKGDLTFKITNILSSKEVIVSPEFPSNSSDKVSFSIDDNFYEGIVQSSQIVNGNAEKIEVSTSAFWGYKDRVLVFLDSVPQAIGLCYYIKAKVKEYIESLKVTTTSELITEEFNG